MSELINNREERQAVLKELIMELHNGKDVEDVRERFSQLIEGLEAVEIAQMEQNLIIEGIPIDEIKRLCDVHVSVFKDALEKIPEQDQIPGHPIYTFKQENREIEKIIDEKIQPALSEIRSAGDVKDDLYKIVKGLELLAEANKHYSRKENLLFPFLEKYGITGPSKVMWSHHDDIRVKLKESIRLNNEALENNSNFEQLINIVNEVTKMIKDMIYKEEKILFRTSMEFLTQDEWWDIASQSDEIGYCLIEPKNDWKNKLISRVEKVQDMGDTTDKNLKFETGILTLDEINLIFNNLPIDITFVDKNDIVKYFSNSKERIFTRTKAIIGRAVQNCHPPASVHVVEKIVSDFKDGKRNDASFWIQMGDIFAYIRYFAIRDEKGEYAGTLEVTQNITDIKKLEGQKRLLD